MLLLSSIYTNKGQLNAGSYFVSDGVGRCPTNPQGTSPLTRITPYPPKGGTTRRRAEAEPVGGSASLHSIFI